LHGALVLDTGVGRVGAPYWPGASVLPGSENQAHPQQGFPGT
jgi:hypothetical protein